VVPKVYGNFSKTVVLNLYGGSWASSLTARDSIRTVPDIECSKDISFLLLDTLGHWVWVHESSRLLKAYDVSHIGNVMISQNPALRKLNRHPIIMKPPTESLMLGWPNGVVVAYGVGVGDPQDYRATAREFLDTNSSGIGRVLESLTLPDLDALPRRVF